MLILGRKPGEKVLIGDDVVVTYLGHGRLGFDAPQDVAIVRDELETRQDVVDSGCDTDAEVESLDDFGTDAVEGVDTVCTEAVTK